MKQVGAIATGHEESAKAGAQVLANGGNAVDAATAGAFAACMCEPTLTGLGGAGFATVHTENGDEYCLDFFAAVPGVNGTVKLAGQPVPIDVLFGTTTQTFHVGPYSCAVPGFVKGVLKLHEDFGTMPLTELMQPAVELSRGGLKMQARQAYCHHLLTPILTRTKKGRGIFAPAGPMLAAGDYFYQPELADTLKYLAEAGADAFYTGDIAAEIIRWSKDNEGLITPDDLARYEVAIDKPVRSSWRGQTFITPPPPSSGGALIAFALQVLERINGGADGPRIEVETPRGAELVVAAMLAANGIRGEEFDEWLYSGRLVERLLAPDVVARGEELAQRALAGDTPPEANSLLGSTTHLSVIDANGCAVSMTTSTGCGSGEFVGSTGIHLNNMMGEEDLVPVEHVLNPGERLTSMMAPSLVISEFGKPLLAAGSAGSNRIRGAITQSLLRIFETRGLGRLLQDRLNVAVQASRLHAEGGLLHAEAGVSSEVLQFLASKGHKLEHWNATNMYFGGANMVAVGTDKTFAAAGDHRRGGGAFVAFADGSIEARQ